MIKDYLQYNHNQVLVDIELNEVTGRLKEQKVEISLNKKAKDFIIKKGFDKVFGARPLKRAIQWHLENPLAEEILAGSYREGTKIDVSVDKSGEKLVFKTAK